MTDNFFARLASRFIKAGLIAFSTLMLMAFVAMPQLAHAQTTPKNQKTFEVKLVVSGDVARKIGPKIRLRINGDRIFEKDFIVTAQQKLGQWQTISVNYNAHEIRRIRVVYINDLTTATEDRNLYIRSVSVLNKTYLGTDGALLTSSSGSLTAKNFADSASAKGLANTTSKTANPLQSILGAGDVKLATEGSWLLTFQAPCGDNQSGSTYDKSLSTVAGSRPATTAECPYGGTVAITTTTTQSTQCTNGTEAAQSEPVVKVADAGAPVCQAAAACGDYASGSTYSKIVSTSAGTRNSETPECPRGGTIATTTTVSQTYQCTNGIETAVGTSTSRTVDSGAFQCNAAPAACGNYASGSTYSKTLSSTASVRNASEVECPFGGTIPTLMTTKQTYQCTNGTETAQGSSVLTTTDNGAPTCNVAAACGTNASGTTYTKTVSGPASGTRAATTTECPNGGTVATTTTTTQSYQCTNGNETTVGSPTVTTADGTLQCNIPSNYIKGTYNYDVSNLTGAQTVTLPALGVGQSATVVGNSQTTVVVNGCNSIDYYVWAKNSDGSVSGVETHCAGGKINLYNAPRVLFGGGQYAQPATTGMAWQQCQYTRAANDISKIFANNVCPWGVTCGCSAKANGSCGTANGKTDLLGTPQTNSELCAVGNAANITEALGTFTWNCSGIEGGTSTQCSAKLTTNPVDGQCGGVNNQSIAWNKPPVAGLCAFGKASALSSSTNSWGWSCDGLNGGKSASCSATKLLPVDGQCGLYNGVTLASQPLFNLCSVGSASAVTGTGPWNWTCTGIYEGATVSCQALKGTGQCLGPPMQPPAGAIVYAPATPVPSQSGDIVGAIIQNLSADSNARYQTFGQVFRKGQLQPGTSLVARFSGKNNPLQLDTLSTWDDGSVKMAALTVAANVCAGSELPIMIARGTPDISPGTTPVNLTNATFNLTAELNFTSGSNTGLKSYDLGNALKLALAKPETTNYWLRGPLATQARVSIRLPNGNMYITADITAYKDGETLADVQFNNDLGEILPAELIKKLVDASGYTYVPRLPPEIYAARVTLDGQSKTFSRIEQYQYQNWRTVLRSKGEREINVQKDPAYLISTTAILPYDLKTGVNNDMLVGYYRLSVSSGFGEPLATNGVMTSMPTTGGRADIGYTTMYNTVWLISQDWRAARIGLAQGDASGSVPWNFKTQDGQIITTDTILPTWNLVNWAGYPYTRGGGPARDLWAGDDRCNMCLKNGPSGGAQSWAPDTAHRPNLTYVPYIQTAQRWYLDLLNNQAANNVTGMYPESRCKNANCNLFVYGNQIRGAAWSMREVMLAAFIGINGSSEQKYFAKVLDENWEYLITSNINSVKQLQGEAYGWVMGVYGDGTVMAPWQQDFFSVIAAWSALQGNQKAKDFVAYQKNWQVGRFSRTTPGWNAFDGCVYNMAIYDPVSKVFLNTWKQMGEFQVAWKISNGTTPCGAGYFGPVARAALISYMQLNPNDAEVGETLNWFLKVGITGIDQESLRRDPTWNLAVP